MTSGPGARSTWLVWPLAAFGYLVLAALATWPFVTRFGAEIPGELTDPLEHLWLMRWLRSCLLTGRNPLFCPELQAPIGVPLGYFPTLHLQTILYILGRLVTANDTAIFGSIWFLGFLATGLASFGLARWALEDCPTGVAWVAGLGVMLTGPMLMHAHGHLETMQLGVVPPFLIAWIRFADQPDRRRLIWNVVAYLVLVAAAPYFAVLAIFPAVWYLVWLGFTLPRVERWPQARSLAPWLVGFGLIALLAVALLFSPQIWAALQGWPMGRSKHEFDLLGAPVWSNFVPSPRHLLGKTLIPNLFVGPLRGKLPEVSSYLGVVALGLLAWALWKRVNFPRRGYWWSVLALMIVLSWGSRQEMFGATPSLPAGWIYGVFPPFHLIRVPARFNLFAAAVAVVPMAAGLRAILHRVRWDTVRVGLLIGMTAVTLADLAMVPFPSAPIPPLPAVYADLKRDHPTATILDAPLFDSTRGQTFSALWGYWQQIHGLRTSAGYPGLTNSRFDAEIARDSVFGADRLEGRINAREFGMDGTLDPGDRAWLELTAHGFDYVVLRHEPSLMQIFHTAWFDRFPAAIAQFGQTYSGAVVVPPNPDGSWPAVALERNQLALPRNLTWMSDRGWRPVATTDGELITRYAALASAQIEVCQPVAGHVTLILDQVEAFQRARLIRLMEGDRELARWRIEPGSRQDLRSPALDLAVGRHTWTLISDGADRPTRSADRLDDAATPFSFRLSGVRVVAGESGSAPVKD